MDFETNYEIEDTADFIHRRNFSRVALQFPDELLKDSMRVVGALRDKLQLLKESGSGTQRDGAKEVRLFVMADATYGSCCVDEVGASHSDGECVIHYGHTCLSPSSTLPAFFVLGKASVDASKCAESLSNYASTSGKPVLVLYGLEYAHAISHIQDVVVSVLSSLNASTSSCEYHFADVASRVTDPPKLCENSENLRPDCDCDTSCEGVTSGFTGSIGGLIWSLPKGSKMEDYSLYWIGSENSAFANAVLTFNGCEIVRYDVEQGCLMTDLSLQRKILKRRYYLVEKAKDANIVGILVGTLGVAGYLNMIHQMKDLITAAGKKAYTFVMGRPNPAKLANFPECDVFVYVSCPQTALLDSKEFLAPVITPFEAMLSFSRGREWTGAYVTKFWDLIDSPLPNVRHDPEEARFSLIQGRYVEDFSSKENVEEEEENGRVVALSTTMEKALQLRDKSTTMITSNGKGATSGAEYFATRRTYHGLDMYHDSGSTVEPFLIGRSGKASGYEGERNKPDTEAKN
ncbi:unnamed protein product [Linum tenue]|uniref:2-(3-amino-3-carboxypropyl)histidine synthase subunit 2 n=1 Tax=Linum tenue TaxID=586396 RepID=A0AAV0NJU3_9ROSI|nr:unnamed protein product [Linum tenue]